MRFLVDECTGPAVAQWLRSLDHEVFSVFDDAKGITDEEVLKLAFDENRILITNDKDFGELIYREKLSHHGVVLMRLDDERSTNKISVLSQLLHNYSEKLADAFVTVTETKVRIVARRQ
jgi:predicted nuclease of predicted toxin-antitoxin system